MQTNGSAYGWVRRCKKQVCFNRILTASLIASIKLSGFNLLVLQVALSLSAILKASALLEHPLLYTEIDVPSEHQATDPQHHL